MGTLSSIFSLILALLGIALVLYLSYKFSKYLASKVNTANNSSNIHVLERATLGQDKCLAIIEICDKFYVVGIANNNIDILLELDNYEPSEETLTTNSKKFLDILKDTVKDTVKKKPVPKAGEDNDHSQE